MTPNLHELINNPGAGKHIPALVKSGHWDEYAGLPKKKWSVEVEYTITDTEEYTVDASCEDESYDKAGKLAAKDYDYFEFTSAREL
jgi:outer membrane receptor for Fe3+-dicitrate